MRARGARTVRRKATQRVAPTRLARCGPREGKQRGPQRRARGGSCRHAGGHARRGSQHAAPGAPRTAACRKSPLQGARPAGPEEENTPAGRRALHLQTHLQRSLRRRHVGRGAARRRGALRWGRLAGRRRGSGPGPILRGGRCGGGSAPNRRPPPRIARHTWSPAMPASSLWGTPRWCPTSGCRPAASRLCSPGLATSMGSSGRLQFRTEHRGLDDGQRRTPLPSCA